MPGKLTKQVLDGTYDYKADERKQKAMFEWKERTIKRGGPLTQKVWQAMPQAEEYIDHLRQTYGLKYKDVPLTPELDENDPRRRRKKKKFNAFDELRKLRTMSIDSVSVGATALESSVCPIKDISFMQTQGTPQASIHESDSVKRPQSVLHMQYFDQANM